MMRRTGVDVDRFDYMLRDCMNVNAPRFLHFQLGLNCSYHYDRIIKGARCIRNSSNEYEAGIHRDSHAQICFNEKVNIDVFEMFQCRMSLHRRAYNVLSPSRNHD